MIIFWENRRDYFRESQRNSENRRIILENRRETQRIAGFLDKANETDEAEKD